MNLYHGYPIEIYGAMVNDRIRMEAYASALRQAIRPGCVVVDIGSGPGIFALLACQYGAERVYAIEPDDSIHLARKLAKANGYGEKITFLQAISSNVNLPECANVVISDLRGSLPLFEHAIPAIIDARSRFLAADGLLIPQADTLWAAVVENPKRYRQNAAPWLRNPFHLDLQAGYPLVNNRIQSSYPQAKQLLTPAQLWGQLDYKTIADPDVHASLAYKVARSGTGHGLLLWFDSQLIEGVGFSNAPGNKEMIYGRSFLPWAQPVKLEENDIVQIELHADLVGVDYVWRWDTLVLHADQPGEVKAKFKQSTLDAKFTSLGEMRKQTASYVPIISTAGQHELFVLASMNGQTSLEEISKELRVRFPESFPSLKETLTYVTKLSSQFSD